MHRRPIFLSALGLPILFGIAVAIALMLSQSLVRAANSPITIGGPFTLTAPDGTTVTTGPTALLDIAAALEKLGPAADKVQPLFITVDPQRDTPVVIGDYTRSFDPRIIGLTGTPEQIAAVAREYGAYYAPRKIGSGPEDYVLDHSSYLYLMDPEGKFVRGFDADTPGDRLAEVVRDAIVKARD